MTSIHMHTQLDRSHSLHLTPRLVGLQTYKVKVQYQ